MNEQKQQQNQNGGNKGGQNQQRPNGQQNQPRTDRPMIVTRPDLSSEPVGQKYVSIAIIAFLLGFGAAALWFGDSTTGKGGINATSTTATSSVVSVTETGVNGLNNTTGSGQTSVISIPIDTTPISVNTAQAIVVENQKSGIKVSVASVTLSEPAWLAVTEMVEGGIRILGAQLFDKGVTTNKDIELLRGTLAGRPYEVVIRTDNGDRAFDPKLDKPILNASGMPLSASFVALEQ